MISILAHSVNLSNRRLGCILATGVESPDDLREFGMKSMFAQSLFKHIVKWKAEGVPANILTKDGEVSNNSKAKATEDIRKADEANAKEVRLRKQREQEQRNRVQQEKDQREKQQALQQKRQQEMQAASQAADRQRRAEAAETIRPLAAAITAMENNMHRSSARAVLGLGGKFDCLRCTICQPESASWDWRRPTPDLGEMSCTYNWSLIREVQKYVGECHFNRVYSFMDTYNDTLRRAKAKLQELQRS